MCCGYFKIQNNAKFKVGELLATIIDRPVWKILLMNILNISCLSEAELKDMTNFILHGHPLIFSFIPVIGASCRTVYKNQIKKASDPILLSQKNYCSTSNSGDLYLVSKYLNQMGQSL